MGVVNLKQKQAVKIAEIIRQLPENHEVWIHCELESVLVEVQNAEWKTVIQFRVYEDGRVVSVPWEV